MIPLALLCIKCSEKNSYSYSVMNEMTHKKCKRTGRLTVNIFFPYLETVGAVAE